MNIAMKAAGWFVEKILNVYRRYAMQQILSECGKAGGGSAIYYPFWIEGAHNIYLDEQVIIGANSTIFTTRAKVVVGKKTISGPSLTIITGSHISLPGMFLRDVRKDVVYNIIDITQYDKDVIIGSDVWLAANVTIIQGVTIGRGAIVAAGAVVTKDVAPYSVVGGNPARFIKFKWTVEQILEHESKLYEPSERLTSEFLAILFKSYNKQSTDQ